MSKTIWNKAVIIYPRFDEDTFWSLQRTLKKYLPKSEFKTPKRTLPPLGLMGLFNHLKPYYKEIVLIDRNVDNRPLEKSIVDTDHVYIGGMSAQENFFLEDAQLVMKAGKPLILGGTIVSKEFIEKNFKNYKKKISVENESEVFMKFVLEGLKNQDFGGYYKGIHASPEEFFIPDFSSINLKNYLSMPIQLSRGCPFNCEFCDITTRYGRNIRNALWEHTKQSIEQLHKLGYRGPIFFVDDNFIGNQKKSSAVLRKIYELEEKLGYHFPKYTQISLNISDNTPKMGELRKLLNKTKFTMLFIGVETNNIDSLKETGKIQNLKKGLSLEEKLNFISRETGAAVSLAMIHGFDRDSRESAKSLANFINKTSNPIVMVSLLNALENTRLEKRLKKEGRLMEATSGNNSDGTINFIPYNFSVREAEEDYVYYLLKEIYNEKAYFKRVMRELKIIDPFIQKGRMSTKEGIIFGTSFIAKLLTKKNSGTYLKYLGKVHDIAKERFGLGTKKYWHIIGLYLAHCSKYAHFQGQTNYLEEKLNKRTYKPWQLYSWSQLQKSELESLEVIDSKEDRPLIHDKVKMVLDSGYEFIGNRIQALSHFVEPFLKEGLKKLKSSIPSIDELKNIEINAYLKAHVKMPAILEGIDFEKVKEYITSKIESNKEYMNEITSVLKHVLNINRLKDINLG